MAQSPGLAVSIGINCIYIDMLRAQGLLLYLLFPCGLNVIQLAPTRPDAPIKQPWNRLSHVYTARPRRCSLLDYGADL